MGYVLVVPHADLAAPYVSVADTSSEQAKSASAATAAITEEVESEAVTLLKEDVYKRQSQALCGRLHRP